MKIKVVDNFLSEEEFTQLSYMIPYQVSWHYDDCSVKDNDGCPQFVHSFYYDHRPHSDYFDDVLNVVRVIPDFTVIYRIKANATPRTLTRKIKPFHNDVWMDDNVLPPLKICILMINDNDGLTIIKDENGKEHHFQTKANRALFFPNEYEHTGTTCTDKDLRLVLNIVYA